MNQLKINSTGQIYINNLSKEKSQEDIDEIDRLIGKFIADYLPIKQIIAMIKMGLITKEELCEIFRCNLECKIAIHK